MGRVLRRGERRQCRSVCVVTDIDRDRLEKIVENRGENYRSDLVDWARNQTVMMDEPNYPVLARHAVLWAEGNYPCGEPDWTEPNTHEAVRRYLIENLSAAEADVIPPKLQFLAARMLAGDLKPVKRKGRRKKASKTSNIITAIRVITVLQEEAGIPPHLSEDWRGDGPTGCEIVAEAIGVSVSQVRRWWDAELSRRRGSKAAQ